MVFSSSPPTSATTSSAATATRRSPPRTSTNSPPPASVSPTPTPATPSARPPAYPFFTGRDSRLLTTNSNLEQLSEMDVTMAHILKHAGYDTALFGKYSIGSKMGVTDPLAMGFDPGRI